MDPGDYFDPRDFTYKQDGKVVAFNEWKHADDYDLSDRNST
jgi:hypothetical protein